MNKKDLVKVFLETSKLFNGSTVRELYSQLEFLVPVGERVLHLKVKVYRYLTLKKPYEAELTEVLLRGADITDLLFDRMEDYVFPGETPVAAVKALLNEVAKHKPFFSSL